MPFSSKDPFPLRPASVITVCEDDILAVAVPLRFCPGGGSGGMWRVPADHFSPYRSFSCYKHRIFLIRSRPSFSPATVTSIGMSISPLELGCLMKVAAPSATVTASTRLIASPFSIIANESTRTWSSQTPSRRRYLSRRWPANAAPSRAPSRLLFPFDVLHKVRGRPLFEFPSYSAQRQVNKHRNQAIAVRAVCPAMSAPIVLHPTDG